MKNKILENKNAIDENKKKITELEKDKEKYKEEIQNNINEFQKKISKIIGSSKEKTGIYAEMSKLENSINEKTKKIGDDLNLKMDRFMKKFESTENSNFDETQLINFFSALLTNIRNYEDLINSLKSEDEQYAPFVRRQQSLQYPG